MGRGSKHESSYTHDCGPKAIASCLISIGAAGPQMDGSLVHIIMVSLQWVSTTLVCRWLARKPNLSVLAAEMMVCSASLPEIRRSLERQNRDEASNLKMNLHCLHDVISTSSNSCSMRARWSSCGVMIRKPTPLVWYARAVRTTNSCLRTILP